MKSELYEVSILPTDIESISPQEAAKQFWGAIPEANWLLKVKNRDTGESVIINTVDFEIDTQH